MNAVVEMNADAIEIEVLVALSRNDRRTVVLSTVQLLRRIAKVYSADSNTEGYQRLYRVLVKMEKRGIIDRVGSPRAGYWWYLTYQA